MILTLVLGNSQDLSCLLAELSFPALCFPLLLLLSSLCLSLLLSLLSLSRTEGELDLGAGRLGGSTGVFACGVFVECLCTVHVFVCVCGCVGAWCACVCVVCGRDALVCLYRQHPRAIKGVTSLSTALLTKHTGWCHIDTSEYITSNQQGRQKQHSTNTLVSKLL